MSDSRNQPPSLRFRVISRQNQFRELSMEYAKLGTLVARYRGYVALEGRCGHRHRARNG